jgi:uroporphyrinogen decarboxylase
MAYAKRTVGHRICIAGNIDPVRVLRFGSVEQVRAATLACLSAGAPGGGFVLHPGCDVPQGTPLENMLAFIETAHAWQA